MVFNPKGGVGKTAIALNLALTCGHGVVTNDRSTIIEVVLPFARCLILSGNQDKLPELSADWPVIYDFGGFLDSRIEKVLEVSQYVLVPVLPNISLRGLSSTRKTTFSRSFLKCRGILDMAVSTSRSNFSFFISSHQGMIIFRFHPLLGSRPRNSVLCLSSRLQGRLCR